VCSPQGQERSGWLSFLRSFGCPQFKTEHHLRPPQQRWGLPPSAPASSWPASPFWPRPACATAPSPASRFQRGAPSPPDHPPRPAFPVFREKVYTGKEGERGTSSIKINFLAPPDHFTHVLVPSTPHRLLSPPLRPRPVHCPPPPPLPRSSRRIHPRSQYHLHPSLEAFWSLYIILRGFHSGFSDLLPGVLNRC